jgi:hypothetical protein
MAEFLIFRSPKTREKCEVMRSKNRGIHPENNFIFILVYLHPL